MTLGEFLNVCSEDPSLILFYFLCLPLTAFLAALFGKGEGHLSPWKYLYSVLMYLACVPGIFAITLNVYTFLFERKSVMDLNIYSQILPILVMILTLAIIRKNIKFEQIPGFDKLGGLLIVIGGVITAMWFLDKTHIVVFSYMPVYMVFVILIVMFILIRFGAKKLFA